MRTRLNEVLTVVVSLLVVSCAFPSTHATTCADDADRCPASSRSASTVTCDCRFTIGISEDTGESFDGSVTVCLPSSLNGATASADERVALLALEPRAFDQRVFTYCSHDVARFARMAIKAHGSSLLGACAVPVTCTCSTAGAQLDTPVCHKGCEDVACDAKNCSSVLRTDARLDMSTCYCARATACGVTEPKLQDPSVCRDWTATGAAAAGL